MDLSIENRQQRLRWPCATALVMMLAAAPAFADGGRCDRPPPESSPWQSEMDNPCFKNPATFGRGERIVEHISCRRAGGCGTLTTTSRTCEQGNGFEQRTLTEGDGFGTGEVSQVVYDLGLKNLTVTRSRTNSSRVIIRNREMGNPKRPEVKLATNTGGCSPTNLQACASPFFVETRSETRNGVPVKPTAEPDTECKNRDGSKRGELDD
jgi:hypothetical protein